jgi:hypothetical protein
MQKRTAVVGLAAALTALLDLRAGPVPSGGPPPKFDPAHSAALFVGVRSFTEDNTLANVRYAVDDAVDLAYALSMDDDSRLVVPGRVVLALSGQAQKPESQHRLEELQARGATIVSASLARILSELDAQKGRTADDGMLVISFATHGVNDDGTQFLLAADSLLRYRQTLLSEATVRQVASGAARSLILVDACRQQLRADQRAGDADPRSAAVLLEKRMARISGQVVFSAAAAGAYAYDDDQRGNGVFTANVIDALHCRAATAAGVVTVGRLAAFVEDHVLDWIHRNRDPHARLATQLSCEGDTNRMPLAVCAKRAQ